MVAEGFRGARGLRAGAAGVARDGVGESASGVRIAGHGDCRRTVDARPDSGGAHQGGARGRERTGISAGRPRWKTEMLEDPADDRRLGDRGENAHAAPALGTDQRVDAHAREQPCPVDAVRRRRRRRLGHHVVRSRGQREPKTRCRDDARAKTRSGRKDAVKSNLMLPRRGHHPRGTTDQRHRLEDDVRLAAPSGTRELEADAAVLRGAQLRLGKGRSTTIASEPLSTYLVTATNR